MKGRLCTGAQKLEMRLGVSILSWGTATGVSILCWGTTALHLKNWVPFILYRGLGA